MAMHHRIRSHVADATPTRRRPVCSNVIPAPDPAWSTRQPNRLLELREASGLMRVDIAARLGVTVADVRG